MTVTQAPMEAVAAQSALVEDRRYDADAVVVGAGPAGSAAAYWLASAGLDVALLERDHIPAREGVRRSASRHAERALIDMGIDVSQGAGWVHNRGLRVIARRPATPPRLARAHAASPRTAWSGRGPIWTRCSRIGR